MVVLYVVVLHVWKLGAEGYLAQVNGGESGRLVIREISSADIATIADWHISYFPRGFYARLGYRFISRYYSAQLRSPVCIALASGDAHLAGYVVGTSDVARHWKLVPIWTRLRLVGGGALALTVRPQLWASFASVRIPRYARRSLAAVRNVWRGPTERTDPTGELSYLVTDPAHRGCGIGTQLTNEFMLRMDKAGRSTVMLVTEDTNMLARDFYTNRGWAFIGEQHTRDGVLLRSYRYTISDQ